MTRPSTVTLDAIMRDLYWPRMDDEMGVDVHWQCSVVNWEQKGRYDALTLNPRLSLLLWIDKPPVETRVTVEVSEEPGEFVRALNRALQRGCADLLRLSAIAPRGMP